MIFITGGAWQGKTAFAETLAAGRATPGIGEHVLYAGPKTEESASGGQRTEGSVRNGP